MPQLLLELFCEEIPARMQAKAEADLGSALTKSLSESGLTFGKVETLSGPRRLTVILEDVSETSADVREERKGPKVGAPEKAIEGFLRGAGLTSIDQAEIQSDPKKGDFYIAVIEAPGRAATEIIAEVIPDIVRNFHWPKSMRWGSGDLRWVRPLQRIVCLFGGKIVPFELEGLVSGNETEGHRVHVRGPFRVTDAVSYKTALEGEGHVMLSRQARREKIAAAACKVCEDAGLELIEDAGLLEEVTGLAEWPVVLLGAMDPAFLDLPPEVIQLSMRTHQKYFAVRDPKTGGLAPNFVVVANIAARDGGKKIAEGNSRVLSARLNDARFFWDNDLSTPLEVMGEKLETIDFKKELGTIADKVERVAALAKELAPKVGADPLLAERAARLCKSDLVSEMVYEFPELQGVMGRYYALEWGRKANSVIPETTQASSGTQQTSEVEPGSRLSDAEASAAGMTSLLSGLSKSEVVQIADAIRDHYKPQGPSDAVPTDPVSIAVALADKLDTLVGFWAIDEKPTGSKDPFALRRAALGVVRIVLENGVRVQLMQRLLTQSLIVVEDVQGLKADKLVSAISELPEGALTKSVISESSSKLVFNSIFGGDGFGSFDELFHKAYQASADLLSFFADRLKQYMRDQGKRHDLIDAVFTLGEDDLVLIAKRVEALSSFLDTEDGANLLAGYKRAANILRAEEKKDATSYAGEVDPALLTEKEEKDLFAALKDGEKKTEAALKAEDFEAAMAAMSLLRGPIDAFFDRVTVNSENVAVRKNRLYLLSTIRSVLGGVADFSKIES